MARNPSSLTEHRFEKGKFITPWNALFSEKLSTDSWFHKRLPEYLWLGLILDKFGRDIGLGKCYYILQELHNINSEMATPSFSLIMELNCDKQKTIFKKITELVGTDTLTPLSIIFSYSQYPIFLEICCDIKMPFDERIKTLTDVMKKNSFHQEHSTTDIRFLVLYFQILQGKVPIVKDELDLILKYPKLKHEDDEMRIIRPSIRAAEQGMRILEKSNEHYLSLFWEKVSRMGECELSYIAFNKERRHNQYLEYLHEIFEYLTQLFVSTDPINNKMLVLIGMATYSYKRFLEVNEHNLYNSISGRSAIRSMIEIYIMLKYLIKNESNHEDIWTEYQYYGVGLYKLVVARARESKTDLTTSHVDYKYLEFLINEYIDENFIDMDTSYFDKHNIRIKAEAVGEKELYGLYYDYDSSFEHGLWGAIRESALMRCDSPIHQYHCVPEFNNRQNLKSV